MFLFGEELIKLRKEVSIPQEKLAQKLGFSRSYICKLENGERQPTKEIILKLSQICNLNNYSKNKLLAIGGFDTDFDSSQEHYQEALKLIVEFKEEGMIDNAKKIIEQSILIFDNTIEIYSLLANLYLLKNNYQEAIRIYEDALKFYPDPKTSLIKVGISKAQLIHNLGYVYFEKALKLKKNLEIFMIKQIVENADMENEISEIKKEVVLDLSIALKKFESALEMEPDNEHIVEQIARAYLNRASVENKKSKDDFLKKGILMYDRLISFPLVSERVARRIEASIFIAMSYGKLLNLKESSRLINIIISCNPNNALAFYAKACIYSLNASDNVEYLQISYDNLKIAIDINPALKYEIVNDLDLLNLRLSSLFKNRFSTLYKSIEERDYEK